MTPGVGAFASAKVVTGGGPTISAVEVIPSDVAANTTAVLAVTTTLRASDRVVVMLLKSSTAGTPSISGLGATWTAHIASGTTLDHNLWSATGLTGTGSISVASGGTSSVGDCIAWVLRSSSDSAIVLHGSTEAVSSAATAGVTTSTPDITGCTAGMFAVGGALTTSGAALTFPHGDTVPPSGWTVDDIGGGTKSKFISRQLTASGLVRLVDSAAGTGNHAVIAGVFTH